MSIYEINKELNFSKILKALIQMSNKGILRINFLYYVYLPSTNDLSIFLEKVLLDCKDTHLHTPHSSTH
jgi:hypothetical protein